MKFVCILTVKVDLIQLILHYIFRSKLQEILPACPQRRSILHNDLHLDLLESICKSELYIILCIHLLITSFLKIQLQKV